MSNVVKMVRPSLRVARAVYFTDLTRRDAPVIPIGAFCEIITTRGRGLALKARSSLNEQELSMVSALLRDRMANPFSYLATEFDEAWKATPRGGAIDFLAKRHSAALGILSPRELAASWFSRWLGDEATLKSAVEREFDDAMAKPATPLASPPAIEERIQIAA
jgi:hypothetical protein